MTMSTMSRRSRVSQDFRERLIALRKSRGLSQNQLAAEAGVEQGAVNKAESGARDYSDELLARLAPVLGLDPLSLVQEAAGDRLAGGVVGVAPADTKILDRAKVSSRTKAGTTSGLQEDGLWLVPVYGPVAAGDAIMWTSEDARSMAPIDIDLSDDVDAIFVIRGNSVSDYGVFDGDRVYARRLGGEALPSGQMVIVECEGAYYCKIYRENALGRYLESHEAGKGPVPFPLTGEVRIVARVTGWPTKFRIRS